MTDKSRAALNGKPDYINRLRDHGLLLQNDERDAIAATLEFQARELAEARARILELETVTEEKVERACVAYFKEAFTGCEWHEIDERAKSGWRPSIRAALMAGR
jgi:low affinity Fe/Cu permease